MLKTMSHREDLLAGAVQCLKEKGYARTTARDIVAASGANLASIGYHYGSTQALLNAAVMQAMDEFGAEIARVMAEEAGGTPIERFERFWSHVIESFRTNAGIWMATFDAFLVAQHEPDVKEAIATGLEDGRLLWARALYGADADGQDADPETLRAVGSLFQGLLSGVLVQWLIDPERAPSAADLVRALQAVTSRINMSHANYEV
jgi:AcrR family transcriptional regulator